ncbi:MAG TPA: RNA polymerase recycling motor HelD [Bacillales bacterium]|nr:RNA polymerase recycling motor HelD [Bacillales bacterium]
MSDQNQDRQKEQQRVDVVLNEIEKKQVRLSESAGGLKEGIIDLRKNFWEDVTVNVEEPDDIIETQASIKQQAELLSERERSHGHLSEQLKTLDRLHDTPYFGRIDFIEGNEKKPEPLYIGIASLMDEKEEDFLIYDWRAPISSMYYDYAPGPAQYDTIDGPIKGEITLKRQFIIRNGQIQGLFNTGLTIGDHLLQKMLGSHASTQMKSIVSTIQKEQNRIIRNEKSKFLVVQGVAGSGKTSAALQRVAYLLYAHRETLNAENMILFSPNPLFNSYVATVLPELGEENMRQTTYNEYVEERLGEQFNLEDPFEQMESFLNHSEDPIRLASVQFKAGLNFKRFIDQYVDFLKQEYLIFEDITFQDRKLVSAEKIKNYFYGMDSSISIPNRMELTSEWLLEKIERLEHLERQQPWVEEEVELLDKEDYLNAFKERQKHQQFSNATFDDFDREWEILSKAVVEKYYEPLKARIEQLDFVDVKASYHQLFEMAWHFDDLPENWTEICKWTLKKLNRNELTWEETTPYLYFLDRLQGRKVYTQMRHVFIDEAQDYSPFQLAYLRQLFPHSRMTLLGDVNQAIYTHSLTSPSILSDKGNSPEKMEKVVLTRSYRSTRPIVEFTRQLIKGGELIEAFNREGNKPTLTEVKDETALNGKIEDRIQEMQAAGHQTIAVICKTMAESRKVYEELKNKISIQLMDQETYTFKKGVLVIPAYLAKGIEFDAVILYNVSQDVYSHESERNLFYTACTRAMHELHLFSIGEKSPFFKDVSPDTYKNLSKMKSKTEAG